LRQLLLCLRQFVAHVIDFLVSVHLCAAQLHQLLPQIPKFLSKIRDLCHQLGAQVDDFLVRFGLRTTQLREGFAFLILIVQCHVVLKRSQLPQNLIENVEADIGLGFQWKFEFVQVLEIVDEDNGDQKEESRFHFEIDIFLLEMILIRRFQNLLEHIHVNWLEELLIYEQGLKYEEIGFGE
jgi:hypothetical protein